MRDQIRIIGWLYIVMGILGLAGVLIVGVVMGGVAALAHHEGAPPALFAMVFMVVAIAVGVTAIPCVIAGVGLIRFRPWARILAIVVAVFQIPNLPLGTALAIYTFVVMFNPEATTAFYDSPYSSIPPAY